VSQNGPAPNQPMGRTIAVMALTHFVDRTEMLFFASGALENTPKAIAAFLRAKADELDPQIVVARDVPN
jgi:hypothetical protein